MVIMCGIVGIISLRKHGFFSPDKEVFKDLLVFNSLRGAHSTGVYGGSLGESTNYMKVVGNPYNLINHPDAAELWKEITFKWDFVVGHGRHATKGKINGENAHPFKDGPITMVHNGTIGDTDLVKGSAFDVDSKAIAHALTKYPADKVFSNIKGAFTVVWFDERDGGLHIVRNTERPLALAYSEKEECLYFASEGNMLYTVLSRRGVKFDKIEQIKPFEILSMYPDEKTFKVRNITQYKEPLLVVDNKSYVAPANANSTMRPSPATSVLTGETVKIGDEVVFSINDIVEINNGRKNTYHIFGTPSNFPEAEVAFYYTVPDGEDIDNLYDDLVWKGRVGSISNQKVAKDRGISYIFHCYKCTFEKGVVTFTNDMYSETEYKELTMAGCSCCGKPITDKDDSREVMVTDDSVFCPQCTSDIDALGVVAA